MQPDSLHHLSVNYPHERSVYRIEYPERERPELKLATGVVAVIDCSEDGLRFKLPDGSPMPDIGVAVEGRVRFKRHPELVSIRGNVVRCQGREVALHLAPPGLPRSLLFSEQRFLGSRYMGGGRKPIP